MRLFSRKAQSACLLVLAWAYLLPHQSFAFPEMVRHGYINCTTCHISPTGGGVLTPYGRELSREVLSATGRDGESSFLYGLIKPPDWLSLGGDYRSVYLYQDTPVARQGRHIVMQADLEAAATIKSVSLVASVGHQDPRNGSSLKDHFISRRHYALYKPSEEMSFRGGRFFKSFGINTAEHTIPTKRALGWDQGQETYNLEGAWIGEQWNIYLTGVFGRPGTLTTPLDSGIAFTASTGIAEHFKVGGSYFYGSVPDSTRHVFGPFAILGFTPKFFWLGELDFQQRTPTGASQPISGAVSYQRLDYEFVQGFHGYLAQEYSKLDLSRQSSLMNSFGLGIQYFPRPHFELNLLWQIRRNLAVSREYGDYAYLLFHFYP